MELHQESLGQIQYTLVHVPLQDLRESLSGFFHYILWPQGQTTKTHTLASDIQPLFRKATSAYPHQWYDGEGAN